VYDPNKPGSTVKIFDRKILNIPLTYPPYERIPMNLSSTTTATESLNPVANSIPEATQIIEREVSVIAYNILMRSLPVFSLDRIKHTYSRAGMAGIVSLTEDKHIELLVEADVLTCPSKWYDLNDGDTFLKVFKCEVPNDLTSHKVLIPIGAIDERGKLCLKIGKVRIPTEDDRLYILIATNEFTPRSGECILIAEETLLPFTYPLPGNSHLAKVLIPIKRDYRKIILHLPP
jgi:hypothetical protein